MPELPEIETIKRGMTVNVGATIVDIDINKNEVIRQKEYEPKDLYGKIITQVTRRGKFLVFMCSEKLNLIFHLGMSGRFYMTEFQDEITEPHVHVVVKLDNKKKLIYQDARRFGGVWFIQDLKAFFDKLGVEPLSSNFSADYLYNITRNRKIAIKSLLLNQQLIAGIGNIYADESLFAAGIRPDRSAGSLTKEEVSRLSRAIKKVLKTGVKERGTTFRDYRDEHNNKGNFQNFLKVYGKTDQECPICRGKLSRDVIGGRSSHYCSNCQK